jgi:hypothetical protein
VLDVQPKPGARVRLLAAGNANKNDPNDALSVAVAGLRWPAAAALIGDLRRIGRQLSDIRKKLDTTVRASEAAQPQARPDEDAQREIAECGTGLRQHRAPPEAGADPVPVTAWIKETQARRPLRSTA